MSLSLAPEDKDTTLIQNVGYVFTIHSVTPSEDVQLQLMYGRCSNQNNRGINTCISAT